MNDCPTRCEEWQTCQPGDGGTCKDAKVEIDSPDANAVYGGGNTVRLLARVTDWDGGVFPRSDVPASGTTGVVPPMSLVRGDGGVFSGDFTLPDVGGIHTLTVGWPASGSAKASIDVKTQVCRLSCADWEECVPDVDGGICGDLRLMLAWTAPTEDFTYPPNVSIPLNLSVTRPDGGPFTKAIPFTLDGDQGMLTLSGGSWTGSVMSGTSDRRRTLEAGWNGAGPMHSLRHFQVDATPPVLGLIVVSDGGAFQRDAVIPAVLTSNEPIGDAGLILGGEAMARASCPIGVTGNVACFNLDFSRPVMNGLVGELAARLSGTDSFGNSGSGDGGILQVTRLRWQVTLPGTDTVRAAPALGSDGTLYLGTASGVGTAGKLFALTPAGTPKPGWPMEGVSVGAVQGLAVADAGLGDVVFYSANGSGGAIIAGVSATGGLLNGSNQCNSTGTTYSGIGLISSGGLRAVGVVGIPGTLPDGGTNVGRMCAFSPYANDLDINSADIANINAPVPGTAESATNVAIDSAKAYFIGRGGRVVSSTLSSGWGPSVEGRIGASSNAVFSGSALFQNSADTGWDVVLAGGVLPGNLHYYATGSGFSTIDLSGRSVGQPVLLPASGQATMYVYAAIDGMTLQRFDRIGAAGSALSISAISASPVLGAGGLGYVLDGSGKLTVFSTASSLAASWAAQLPFTTVVVAPPTLDCVRSGGQGVIGARVGVLYVVALDGVVTAVLVDSAKLDDTSIGPRASWPKYQRTAGNAGNIDTSFQFNPGCP